MTDDNSLPRRLVWDLPTRIFHWALAASFAGAYLLAENDGARPFHVMFGYTVAGLVVFRLLWGFVGSRHARFRDFAYGPGAALGYVRDLVRGQARDYEGHNPAGSWAVYALLLLAAATAATGWLNYNEFGGEAFEEVHELLANAWLVMIAVHVAGVVVGSLAHRRNLVATMITGYRRAGGRQHEAAPTMGAPIRPGWVLGTALLGAVVGFWGWSASTGGAWLARPGSEAFQADNGAGEGATARDEGRGEAEDDD